MIHRSPNYTRKKLYKIGKDKFTVEDLSWLVWEEKTRDRIKEIKDDKETPSRWLSLINDLKL